MEPARRPRTLRQYFAEQLKELNAQPCTNPLLDLFFSDSNIETIEDAIFRECAQHLGGISDAKETMTVAGNLAIRGAVFNAAIQWMNLPLMNSSLLQMNRTAVLQATNTLFPDLVYQARAERFRKHGVRPTDISRPQFDVDRMEKLEQSREHFGVNRVRTNPFEEAYGGAVRTYDQFWNLAGTNPAAGINDVSKRTGSDDIRIKFIPDMPVFRQADQGIADSQRRGFAGMARPAPAAAVRAASAVLNNPHNSYEYN